MTYEQALHFWYGRVNYEISSPKPNDLKLDRMRALLDLLDNPQQHFQIIHIAGTKGKGSTSAMLASILRRAGFRTGLFTSPHLVDVEERIQVDNVPIARGELASLMVEVADAVHRLDDHSEHRGVTFFEVATALGFLHFRRLGVQFAIVEVGLGGRFDSTNVCDPLLAVITNISFDHMQYLGNTLAKIAAEKAGIIKPHRPTLSGVRLSEAREVIVEVCRERAAPLREIDRDFSYTHAPAQCAADAERRTNVRITTWQRTWPPLELNLMGEHQAANAALAVAAVEHLLEAGFNIREQDVVLGLANVHWPARMEVLGREPRVVLDCAHNVASADALMRTLLTSFLLPPGAKRLLVFAASRDKDLAGMLAILAPHFAHTFLTTFTNNSRGSPPEELAALMPADAAYTICPTSIDAWQRARSQAGSNDLICITGSVFLAGELRPVLTRPIQ